MRVCCGSGNEPSTKNPQQKHRDGAMPPADGLPHKAALQRAAKQSPQLSHHGDVLRSAAPTISARDPSLNARISGLPAVSSVEFEVEFSGNDLRSSPSPQFTTVLMVVLDPLYGLECLFVEDRQA